MIVPREYQREAYQAVREKYAQGVRRSLVSLPTGTGKTVLFSMIAQAAATKGNRSLILAHRDELIEQAHDKLLQVAPELDGQVGIIKAERNEHDRPVTIASVQSLHARRRANITPTWGIGVVDEAHHVAADSYQGILEDFGFMNGSGKLLLGVTATPQRADGRDLGDTFQEMVYHRDILWMIRKGYLCDLRGIQVKLQMDLADVRVSHGDYQTGDLADALTAAEAPHHIVQAWQRHAADRTRTLVFTPTVDLAGDIAARFNAAGITAVNASAVAEQGVGPRRDMLRRFRDGEIRVLTNASLLTEGYDEPLVDCIAVARPTRSQPLYAQMVGRGTRAVAGKDDCMVLDFVGATDRHDLTTLRRMFGLGDEDADRVAREGAGTVAAEREDEEIRNGQVRTSRIDLFTRTNLAWTEVSDRLWVLSIGENSAIHLDRQRDDHWAVTLRSRDNGPSTLGTGLTQGYAMGTAEDYYRTLPERQQQIASRNAGWRLRPASVNQIDLLRRARVRQVMVPDNQLTLTRGEASDLISAVTARWDRRRR